MTDGAIVSSESEEDSDSADETVMDDWRERGGVSATKRPVGVRFLVTAARAAAAAAVAFLVAFLVVFLVALEALEVALAALVAFGGLVALLALTAAVERVAAGISMVGM